MSKKKIFWENIFYKNPVPFFVLKEKTFKISEFNSAFEHLIGYPKNEISKLELDKVFYKKDINSIKKRLKHNIKNHQHLSGNIRLITKKGVLKELEIAVQRIKYETSQMLLCSLLDVTSHKEQAQEFKEKAAIEHEKAFKTAQKLLGMEQIIEKLNHFPSLNKDISNFKSIQHFINEVTIFITSQTKLNYNFVAFFLIEDNYLKLVSTNKECALHQFDLQKNHRFAQVARGEKKIIAGSKGEYVVPIKSGGQKKGVMQVFLEEEDYIVIVENTYLQGVHWNLLESVANHVGFIIDYFELLEDKKYYKEHNSLTGTYNYNYLTNMLEGYVKNEKSFTMFLFKINHLNLFDINSKKKLMQLINILEENKPKASALTAISNEQLALIIPEEELENHLAWGRDINIKLKDQIDQLAVFIGTCKYSGNDIKEFWNNIYSCISKSIKNNSNNLFYWDNESCEIKELEKHIGTKLF